MSSITTDPTDPRLGRGVDDKPVPQNAVYLVLSEDERAKGFVRPVRTTYIHVGAPGPTHPLTDLTEEQQERYASVGYVKYEALPESELPRTGRYWTQAQLNEVGKGCGTTTTMSQSIAETYARDPKFYGSTYCVHCRKHLQVNEFVWDGTNERVGS